MTKITNAGFAALPWEYFLNVDHHNENIALDPNV